MLQYKIPQNVGIEDKIVGPFSLRQLIILAIGGGISYVLFAITSRLYELNILEYILIVLPALFSLAIAMLKIHNVTFGKYILLMLEFAIKPKKRMWDHRGISALVAPDLTDKKATAKKKDVTEGKDRKDVNLGDLSAMLDSGGFEHVEQVKHEDIDEAQDDDLITEAYFGHKKKDSKTENMYWRTKDIQKKKLDLLAKMKPTAVPAKASPVAVPSQPSVPPTEPLPSAPTPATKKKESVKEHLANVIKEARQNNQAKETAESVATPETPKQQPEPSTQTQATPAQAPEKPAPPAPAQPTSDQDQVEAPKKKRRRRRRRKSKTQAGPVRQDTQVDTIVKSEPVKLIKKNKNREGETSFDDLSKGGEIEINLD